MPDNASFYHAAYAIAAVIYAVYAWSISSRLRKVIRRQLRAED